MMISVRFFSNYFSNSKTDSDTVFVEAIPLGDTKLLEHDLANVLNQLPEDAFNELFTAGKWAYYLSFFKWKFNSK